MCVKRISLLFRILTVGLLLLFYTGCFTPSIRYSRSVHTPKVTERQYLVSPRYDYRVNYNIPVSRLKKIVDSYLGVPYKYGGTTRKGFDCSGFVQAVFRKLNQAVLPRTTRKQRKLGKPVSLSKAKPGDLVFFRGGKLNSINHVGIYFGGGKFAHASTSSGVMYSDIKQSYFKKRFAYIRRIF